MCKPLQITTIHIKYTYICIVRVLICIVLAIFFTSDSYSQDHCPFDAIVNRSADPVDLNGVLTVDDPNAPLPTTYDGCVAIADIPCGITIYTYTVQSQGDCSDCYDMANDTVRKCCLEVLIDPIADFCDGEQSMNEANAVVTDGNMPYSYNWSNGQTTQSFTPTEVPPLTSDLIVNYVVTVTDADGCSDTDEVEFEIQAIPQITNVTVTDAMCGMDGEICIDFLDHDTRTGIEFSLDGGLTWLVSVPNNSGQVCYDVASGSYNIWVRWGNNECPREYGTYVVGDEPSDITTITQQTPETCSDTPTLDGTATVTVVNGFAPFTYAWSNSGTTQTITGLGAGLYTVTVTDANGCTGEGSIDVLDLDDCCGLSATVTIVDETCNEFDTMDGEVSVSPSGGVTPYTYNWSTGATTSSITGLSEGSYQVTITDADGCELIETADVGDLDDCCSGVEMTEQFGSPSQTCNTQRFFNWIDMSCTCCTGTFTITYDEWMEYPAGSGTFIYSGTGTETESCNSALDPQVPLNVCQLDANVNFEVGIEITSVVASDPECNTDHLIGLTWSRTDFITQGWFDACCGVDCDDFTVTGVVVNETCGDDNTMDGSVTLTVSGSSGYSYNWSNGATSMNISGLSAGAYTVTVTDVDDCEEIRAFNVLDNDDCDCPTITSTATVVPETCNDDNTMDGSINITPLGGNSPYIYNWSNGSSSQDIFSLSAGTYTVTITDDDGCTGVSTYVVGDLDDCGADCNCSPILFFQNPCGFVWGLSGTDCSGLDVTLYDPNNVVVGTDSGFGTNTYEPCSGSGNGIYTLTMDEGNGCNTTSTTINITCCSLIDCNCDVTLIDDGDCTLTADVSGTGCDNYSLFVSKWGNNGCSGGNCTLLSTPIFNPTGGIYSINDLEAGACVNLDNDTGYRATLIAQDPACSNVSDSCLDVVGCECDLLDVSLAANSCEIAVPSGCSVDYAFDFTSCAETMVFNANQDVSWSVVNLSGSTHIVVSNTPTQIQINPAFTGSFICGSIDWLSHYELTATSDCDGSTVTIEILGRIIF